MLGEANCVAAFCGVWSGFTVFDPAELSEQSKYGGHKRLIIMNALLFKYIKKIHLQKLKIFG